MIVTYETAQEVRAYLGAAVDKFTDKELQALIDYFDRCCDGQCELIRDLFVGWSKYDAPSEACYDCMVSEDFDELKNRIKEELGDKAFNKDGSYTDEAEYEFYDELVANYCEDIVWDDGICLYK